MIGQMTTFWIEAGQDEADESNTGNSQGVGHLGEHMVQVEAVGTGRSHDGGIGDGGAVVAHNAAGAGSSQTDGAQDGLHIMVEHGTTMGAMMPMVPQEVPVAKADGATDNERCGRQVDLQLAGAGHGVDQRNWRVHAETGQAAQGPREGQDRG